MHTLGVAFRQDVSEGLARVYWAALKDLDEAEWQRALETAAKGLTFFPTIAELRRFAGTGDRISLHAAQDFERVLALGAHHGTLGTVFPRAEKVRELIGEAAADAYTQAGGHEAFRKAVERDDLTWVRKDFVAGYRDAMDAGVSPLPSAPALPQISGMTALIGHDVRSLEQQRAKSVEDKRRDFKALASGETK